MSRRMFGLYTKKLRLRAGLSQLEVARELGLKSGQLVSNWERGQCYPPLEALPVLTRLYRVALRKMFNRYFEALKREWWTKANRGAPDERH